MNEHLYSGFIEDSRFRVLIRLKKSPIFTGAFLVHAS